MLNELTIIVHASRNALGILPSQIGFVYLLDFIQPIWWHGPHVPYKLCYPRLDHIFIWLGPTSPTVGLPCLHLHGNSSPLGTNLIIRGHLSH
jgi:hypothetical protein